MRVLGALFRGKGARRTGARSSRRQAPTRCRGRRPRRGSSHRCFALLFLRGAFVSDDGNAARPWSNTWRCWCSSCCRPLPQRHSVSPGGLDPVIFARSVQETSGGRDFVSARRAHFRLWVVRLTVGRRCRALAHVALAVRVARTRATRGHCTARREHGWRNRASYCGSIAEYRRYARSCCRMPERPC